ncbi:DsrE family protein [Proteobacteria bacterium 005FR1]|nr:DsrE family protein [Proteobacteria bacterium 005FR1]
MGTLLMLYTTLSGISAAAKTSDASWQTPVISQARVKHLPDAAVPLNPDHSYKLLFDISQGAKSPGELLPALVRVGRFINLAALAEVPPENVQLAVVIHGPATLSMLKEEVFNKRFGEENQNLNLLTELKKAGVEIFVCGQALAHLGLHAGWVTEDVEVAVAALTVAAEYQLKGYKTMP